MKFVFSDGENIGIYDEKGVRTFESNYIAHYRESSAQSKKNKAWKNRTERMLSDDYYFDTPQDSIAATLHGVSLTSEENKIVYAFSVNDSSGIYSKLLDDETKTEAHIVSSNEVRFNSVCRNTEGEMLAAVQSDPVTARIAVFSKDDGDYKCVTGGDSLDENPSFSPDGKSVFFNSYGVGRDANNNFVEYASSEIYKLDLSTMDVETVVSDPKYSYIKPVCDEDGNLYCIKKPGTENTRENPLIEILLIPVRVVQAIAGFVSAFVMCFAQKPLVSGQGRASANGSAAKNPSRDAKKIFVNNSLVNVDKELKKNKKQENYGFIPPSWKLVKRTENGEEKEIASGVADFCIVREEGKTRFVYTNGKHIFSVCEGEKRKKLVDTDFCLKVGSLSVASEKSDGLFDLL